MTKEQCRAFAAAGCPVVHSETGAVPEVVYLRIVAISARYADEEERAERGFPPTRLTVTVLDAGSNSVTETVPRSLRAPTVDEMIDVLNREDELRERSGKPRKWTLAKIDKLVAFLNQQEEEKNG